MKKLLFILLLTSLSSINASAPAPSSKMAQEKEACEVCSRKFMPYAIIDCAAYVAFIVWQNKRFKWDKNNISYDKDIDGVDTSFDARHCTPITHAQDIIALNHIKKIADLTFEQKRSGCCGFAAFSTCDDYEAMDIKPCSAFKDVPKVLAPKS